MTEAPDPLADTPTEHELLGGLLKHNSGRAALIDRLADSAVCADPVCRDALAAISASIGGAPDSGSIQSVVRQQLLTTYKHPQQVVAKWLSDCATAAPLTPDTLPALADRVLDLAQRRAVRDGVLAVAQANSDPATTSAESLASLEALLAELRSGTSTGDTVIGGEDALQSAIEKITDRMNGNAPGMISTGSVDLDDVLGGGLEQGRVHITGGRPGSGKSVHGIDTARAALRNGHGAIIFSYEMPADEVLSRVISAEACINTKSLRSGQLSVEELERFVTVNTALPWDNLAVIDKSHLTVEMISTYVRQIANRMRDNGIDQILVVIDYVQLIRPSQIGGRNSTRQIELGHITRTLKMLARDSNVALHALAQVGRTGESRRPMMSDLRESGDLESDADVVILLHCPSSIDPEDRPGECDFIIAKNRAGETGGVRVRASRFRYARFDDMAAA